MDMTIFSLDLVGQYFANVMDVLTDNIGAIVAVLGFVIGISFVLALMDVNRQMKWLDHEKRRWSAIKGWRTRRARRIDGGGVVPDDGDYVFSDGTRESDYRKMRDKIYDPWA